jgi:hypothetical protein
MDSGNPLRLEPLGQSGAAAVVVSALYFIGVLATIANWVVTKFTFYDVVLIACIRAFARRKLPSMLAWYDGCVWCISSC